MGGLSWIDALLLLVLGGSVLLGVLRGLVFEVLSLLGWLVAWWCAQAWADPVGALLPFGAASQMLRHSVGFVLCFVAVLLGWRLLTWLVQQIIKATPLAPLDRVLGAIFGLLRGGVIALVIVLVLGWTPLASTAAWQSAKGVGAAQYLLSAFETPQPEAAPSRGSGSTRLQAGRF